MTPADVPTSVLAVVADPQRWRVLAELSRSDRRVGELTEITGSPQNLVSYHLGMLRRAGLVTSRRSSADGRDVYYRAHLDRCGDALAAVGAALHPGLRLTLVPPAQDRPTGRRTPRVLFLCTGNSARSQMAEALLVARSAGHVQARSAGSHPKVLHPVAVRVMAERGIDIAGNTTKHLDRFVRTRFDRVITLCDKVREICPELPAAAAKSHWSIADPASAGDTPESTYQAFVAVADELETRIGLLLAELATPTTTREQP